MSCWGGDNNTGITVVDVTDPEDAAYGFLSSTGSPEVDSLFDESAEDDYDSDDNDPQTGGDPQRIGGGDGRDWREVLAAEEENDVGFVTDSDSDSDDLQNAMSQLWKAKVVKDLDIIEAWPRAFKLSKDHKQRLMDREKEPAVQASPISSDIPSLLSLTIRPVFMQVLKSGDHSYIEPVLLQIDKHPHFLAVLRELPEPLPDTGLALVQKIAEEMGGRVDLSSVQLSAEQLVQVLTRDIYDEIDLSGNTQLTQETFPHLLASLPPTRRLVLFRTPISVKDMQKLLLNQTLFCNVHELVHPAMHNWTDTNDSPEAFTVEVYQDSKKCRLLTCSKNAVCLPLCSPAPIAQNLIVLLELMLSDNLMMFHFDYAMLAGDAALEAVFGTALLPEGCLWSEREVSCTPCPPSGVKPNEGGWRFLLEFDRSLPHRAKYGFVRTMPDGSFGAEPKQKHEYTSHEAAEVEEDDGNESDWTDVSSDEDDDVEDGKPRVTDVTPAPDGPSEGIAETTDSRPFTKRGFYVYDLPGFLERLEKDGKPPLPPALEEKLREVFNRLSETAKLLKYCDYKARRISAAKKVMTWESVNGIPWG